MNTMTTELNKKRLESDFERVIADTEALLKATANQGGDMLNEARSKAEESLNLLKLRMAEAQSALAAKTREACRATDEYVHEKPWQSVGTAAFLGLMVGLLVGRR